MLSLETIAPDVVAGAVLSDSGHCLVAVFSVNDEAAWAVANRHFDVAFVGFFPRQIESALRHAGEAFDLVLTCGGVSAGEKDHLPALLQRRGRVHFWKVLMRPGMPALLADGGTLGPALFLCLPGNPVSVLATCLALARPLLDGMQGRAPRKRWRARLAAPWDKRHDRLEFLRGRLASCEDGHLLVEPDPADGSHRMRAAADADALIVLDEGARRLEAGDVVQVLPY